MIHLLPLADASVTDSTYVGPGAMLLAALGLLAAAAKFYKEARQIDVEGEKNRRVAAEAREKKTSDDTASKVGELTEKVESLEKKIDDLRVSNERKIEQLRADHERELLAERTKNFKLRALLASNGIDIPKELGPS
jgi:uncharacterized protein YlxW (UPF0749 family)